MAKNQTPKIGEQNVETGELVYRAMTDVEIEQFEIDKALSVQQNAEAEAKQIAKQEILDRIGLTTDELKTILG